MANRLITTNFFRVSFPHLAVPHKQKENDPAKYQVSMMFPKTGITTVTGQPTSSWQNIFDALNEVCQEEWKLSFEQATAAGMGVNFPPKLKDGDTNFVKDQQGNPLLGQVRPETAGMWILSTKNIDPVDCVSPCGKNTIAPEAVYAGCWARAQIECSAYTGKQGRVVVVKLINLQKCYDDTEFSVGGVKVSGTAAFANMAVTDTNIQQGSDAVYSATPTAIVSAPVNTNPVIMNAGEASYAEYVKLGWTAELLIQHGKATPNFLNPAV